MTGPSARGPLVWRPLVVLIVMSNVPADSHFIVLDLYRDKLTSGLINLIIKAIIGDMFL